ncbi:MAG: ATP-binding protein [Leptolyngbya sp. BL-A-14]
MDSSTAIAQNLEPECHTLTLKNRLDELETLSDWISRLSSRFQLSSRGAFRLEITLIEAVTNIINYAYEDVAEHEITIVLRYLGNTASIEMKDDGKPFNPLEYPAVVLPSSLEEAQEGGLGIHLIRSYVDECSYQRDGNQNVFTVIIRDSD